MSTRHRPGSVWLLRNPWVKVGQTNGLVRTLDDDHIGIGVWGDFAVGPGSISLTRRDARLLAKRINQCLDETARGKRTTPLPAAAATEGDTP